MPKRGRFIYILAVLVVSTIGIAIYAHFNHKAIEEAALREGSTNDLPKAPLAKSAPHIHRNAAQDAEAADDEADEINPLGIPREKVEEYLQKHNRSAASLLAAFH